MAVVESAATGRGPQAQDSMAVADAVGGSRAVVDLATGGNGISERDEEGCENKDSRGANHDFPVADWGVHGKLTFACGPAAVNRPASIRPAEPGIRNPSDDEAPL
ncbi:MAG: hypothetical protein IPI48_12720 [bacterium]|nr:hypothetical protein [bacterium]